jgi:hypothetical protein
MGGERFLAFERKIKTMEPVCTAREAKGKSFTGSAFKINDKDLCQSPQFYR